MRAVTLVCCPADIQARSFSGYQSKMSAEPEECFGKSGTAQEEHQDVRRRFGIQKILQLAG